MLALLAGGLTFVLRDAALWVSRAQVSSPVTVIVFAVLFGVCGELTTLPVRFYRGFLLERRYGLSEAPFRTWAVDHLKGFSLSLLLGAGAAGIVYLTLERFPRWWWAISAGVFVVAVILFARLTPVVLLPIFYRFRPLERPSLRARLESLSARAGLPVLGVYEWGLGEKTRRANAALVGTGRSRRILLSDTLLAQYSDDEIEVILAHELGHHAHRDIRNGLLLEALLIVATFGVAAAALHALWQPLRLLSPADVAGLPLLFAAGGLVALLARPGLHALSRRNEHRADRFALEMTERPEAFVSAMRRLAAQNLAEERPSATTLWLFHTHPPFEARIQAARTFLA
jgi:STE24 endopeptidase